MKTIDQELNDALKESGKDTSFSDGFLDGLRFAEKYIPIEDELPSIENTYINVVVLVCVKNSNKPDESFVWDICSFDGSIWYLNLDDGDSIIGWRPIMRDK